MSEPIIAAERLSKRYHIRPLARYPTLRDNLVQMPARLLARLRGENHAGSIIWALQDVSFTVERGEVLGIIGRNGAGKTTLLRLLSRITRPTGGRAVLHGRVGSLLEVGTGFHPELSGRENVYLSGAVLGMKRREINAKFDEIVAFAGVEKFLETPLKRYSVGMQMRLAFAVAAHLEPEILLVDEVLAVGDLEFQKKCLGKMGEVARGGRTVLFVSHNLGAVVRLCHRCLWISAGRVVRDGPSADVVNRYQSESVTAGAEWVRPDERNATEEVSFLRARVSNAEAQPTCIFAGDQPVNVQVEYIVRRPISGCQIGARVDDASGSTILTTSDADGSGQSALPRDPGRYTAKFTIPGGFLAPGTYSVFLAAHAPYRGLYDAVEQSVRFEVSQAGSLASLDGRLGAVAPLFPWKTDVEAGS